MNKVNFLTFITNAHYLVTTYYLVFELRYIKKKYNLNLLLTAERYNYVLSIRYVLQLLLEPSKLYTIDVNTFFLSYNL